MSKIEIILTEPHRGNAVTALRKQGHQVLLAEYAGPVFADAKYKFNAQGVEVHVGDNVYAYPAHSYSRIKVSPSGSAA